MDPTRLGMVRTWFSMMDWASRAMCRLCAGGVPLEARGASVIHAVDRGVRTLCAGEALIPGMRQAWSIYREKRREEEAA